MKITLVLTLCHTALVDGLRVRRDAIGQNRLLNNVEHHRNGLQRRALIGEGDDFVEQIGDWLNANRPKEEKHLFHALMRRHTARKNRRYRKFVHHWKKQF